MTYPALSAHCRARRRRGPVLLTEHLDEDEWCKAEWSNSPGVGKCRAAFSSTPATSAQDPVLCKQCRSLPQVVSCSVAKCFVVGTVSHSSRVQHLTYRHWQHSSEGLPVLTCWRFNSNVWERLSCTCCETKLTSLCSEVEETETLRGEENHWPLPGDTRRNRWAFLSWWVPVQGLSSLYKILLSLKDQFARPDLAYMTLKYKFGSTLNKVTHRFLTHC